MLKRYSQFINEADEAQPDVDKPIEAATNKYTEVKDEVKSMIEKTIEKSGGEFKSFTESFLKTPDDVKIEGLINDSDIYDFYLKWRNDIDEMLNDVKFYDESPSESSVFGLYDYLIKGTERAIEEFVKGL
jgi:hypothetical protein